MKRLNYFILIICLCLITLGCNRSKSNETVIDNPEEFILEKMDSNKDWVYLEPYRDLKYGDGTTYNLQNIVINIKSDAVDNVNLEINSFVKKSYKDMKIINGMINEGNIISYDTYNSDHYISVIQKYHTYMNGQIGEEKNNIYVISKKTGNNLNNEDILKEFEYTQEDFYKRLESRIDSEDVLYTIMNIKKDGYSLYVNHDNQLVVIYYEVSDDDTIRKELILD